jgi:hypothetical protein
MKTSKLFLLSLVIAFIVICIPATAQTYQQKVTAEFEDWTVYCYNREVSGSFIIIVTYHVNKKTGKIDNIHFTIPQSDMWDSETGERLIIHDTGHDNLGYYWTFFNNLNGMNGYPEGGLYSVEDGWLDPYMPDVFPDEGTLIEMNFRYNFKGGGNLNYSTLLQLHRKSNGEITVDMVKNWIDCN